MRLSARSLSHMSRSFSCVCTLAREREREGGRERERERERERREREFQSSQSAKSFQQTTCQTTEHSPAQECLRKPRTRPYSCVCLRALSGREAELGRLRQAMASMVPKVPTLDTHAQTHPVGQGGLARDGGGVRWGGVGWGGEGGAAEEAVGVIPTVKAQILAHQRAPIASLTYERARPPIAKYGTERKRKHGTL